MPVFRISFFASRGEIDEYDLHGIGSRVQAVGSAGLVYSRLQHEPLSPSPVHETEVFITLEILEKVV
jgi:hypothetical protein